MNAYKNDVEKSAQMLEIYYKMKKSTPEFFANRDLDNKEIQSSLDHQDYVSLPVTPDNQNLIFHRLSSYEPKHYIFDEAVKTFIIACEVYAYHKGPRSGTIFVFDLKNVRLGHIFQPSIGSIRKGIRFLEEGNPFDITAVHVLNTVPFFNLILGLVKPFAMSEMVNKVQFHSGNMDYEKFYKECIPRSHLPSDFGGDLASIEQLHKENRADIMKLRDYFLLEEQQANRDFDMHECDDAKALKARMTKQIEEK